jgi:RNA polymerase sigma factor (sigma-70 family)
MVRSREEAEDLLQNSFVDVFTKLDSFRFESSIGAWIKRIVVNNCINHLKKRRLKFEELDERVTGISDSGYLSSEQNGLNVDAIKRAMNELPDGYRVVFTLYMLEGYDHKEIGQILGVTEATSKSQYSRAKRKLREIIQAHPLESPG